MKRLTWIDVAKGLGILLVVLAHTRFPSIEMSWWINSFHMPLFFVVAGLCYDETRYTNLVAYLKRKTVALVYPYFTLSVLAIGLVALLYFGSLPCWSPWQMLMNMLQGSPGGAFWFITVLLEVEVAYAVLNRLIRLSFVRMPLLLVLSLSAAYFIPSSMPYFADTALVAVFFYGLGHACREPTRRALTLPRIERWTLIVCLIVTLLDVVLILILYRYKATFASRDLKDPAFYFILAILGTLSLLAFSVTLDQVIGKLTKCLMRPLHWCLEALRFLGRNTIVILAFHNFLGLCRSSWALPGWLSQVLEFMILGLLLWLLAGPLHILVSPRLTRK